MERLRSKLSDPRFVIAEKQQQLDDMTTRLERHIVRRLARRRASLEQMYPRLLSCHPRTAIGRDRLRLGPLTGRLESLLRARLARAAAVLSQRGSQLDALSPLSVLSRGYAIASRADGRVVRRAADVNRDEPVRIRLQVGHLDAIVTGKSED